MILVDANILMYAAGAEHPHREACQRFLASVAAGRVQAALDTETLQEVLHRYRSIGKWAIGLQIYDDARVAFASILPITVEVLDGARELMVRYPVLVARDAVHVAAANVNGIDAICSFDRDLDQIRELRRVEPV